MIPVQNIYYMLAYAFQILNEAGYKSVAAEQFDNAAELCAAILIRGTSLQIKRGLAREYISETDTLTSLKGKIDITESIKSQTMLRRQMVCSYDEFSSDIYFNQIIKTTLIALLRADIGKARKKSIRKILIYFEGIDVLDIHSINWAQRFSRNTQTYRMLISICYLVVKGLIQTNDDGSIKLMDFVDSRRMCTLYEKFILEYYKKEHREIKTRASQIPWQTDDGYTLMLPVMQTDIMLSKGNKILIIDAKYYEENTAARYDKHTFHSNNLYQIFTYVKNKEFQLKDESHEVAGMLLYAKTDNLIQPNNVYQMSGNQISVQTLDLNQDFTKISRELDSIVKAYFG